MKKHPYSINRNKLQLLKYIWNRILGFRCLSVICHSFSFDQRLNTFCTTKLSTRKKKQKTIGLTKYPQEKIFHPRNNHLKKTFLP